MRADLRGILKRHWGFDGYLPLQQEAMQSVLGGRDSLVVLPTGGGKSLCYQAPAVALPGTAVVISPLISLMKDQVDALHDAGVAAAFLNSSLSTSERRSVYLGLREGEFNLLYVSPERLMMEGFQGLLREIKVSFFAIDEAHCISFWGHDFRKEYRALRVLNEIFPDTGIHGFTATATEAVRKDICRELKLHEPKILVGPFDRPNLVYKVERRANRLEQVSAVLARHRSESSIVYCIRRKDVDDLCASLSARGFSVLPYHAGMGDEARKRNQEAFLRDEADTMVATVAFGMGIDKSNVRCVIHAGAPKSLEHYQQETGRAGRDGLEAECRLLFSDGDFRLWRIIIEQSESEAGDAALRKLNEIYNYCVGMACRHRALVGYFGQHLENSNCEACDVCLGDLVLVDDPHVLAQKILSCVVRLQERFGADYTAAVLCGSKDQRILNWGHDSLSTWGLLSAERKRDVRDWIEQLVDQDYLEKEGEYQTLRVTPKGWNVLKEDETPRLLMPSRKPKQVSKASRESWEGVDGELFERLRDLRRDIAREKSVPAYIVFSDASLREMARHRPASLEEFLQVHGVGAKKSEAYGETFLRAIRP